MNAKLPDFFSVEFLHEHARSIMAFYHPRAIDESGGHYQFWLDDGRVFDRQTRHLVSSARYVVTYARACMELDHDTYYSGLCHALAFLREQHRLPDTGGYAWLLDWQQDKAEVRDATNHCYGLAFVLLAYAYAQRAGASEAKGFIEETYQLMEARFWDEAAGLYADEADAQWRLSDYRGQNANMHACEALLAAFDATGENLYLARADLIAKNIAQRQAALSGGQIWEHYTRDWQIDWEYNRGDRSNIFRPWGFQPGHQTEWAKLLLMLNDRKPQDWLLPRAVELFDAALPSAWDDEYGGIIYGTAPDGSWYDDEKYHWVQAESFSAALLLAERTGEARFRQWYERIWTYCWTHFVDHQHGAWFRILTRENQNTTDQKSIAGKVDYHNLSACYDVISELQ